MRNSLAAQIVVTFLLLGGFLLAAVAVGLKQVNQSRTDARAIEIAGRQRTLSQQQALLAFELIHGEGTTKARLLSAIQDHQAVLDGLKHGDPALGLRPPTPRVQEHLALACERWAGSRPHLAVIAEAAEQEAAFRQAAERVWQDHELLRSEVHQLASELAEDERWRAETQSLRDLIATILSVVHEIGLGRAYHAGELKALVEQMDTSLQRMGELPASEPLRQRWQELRGAMQTMSQGAAVHGDLLRRERLLSQASNALLAANQDVVAEMTREAEQRMAGLVRLLLGTLCLGFLLVGISVRRVIRLLRPLSELDRATQRVAAGDLRAEVQAPAGTEIGRLADSFNNMVVQLSEARRALVDRHEEELEAQALRYQTLIEVVPVVILKADLEGNCVWANVTGLAFLGEDVLGRSLSDLLGMETERLDRLGAESEPAELTLQRPGEEARVLLCRFTPLRDREGNPAGLLCSGHELTARKRLESALREELRQRKLILETALDGFWITDLEGRIREANPVVCDMLGYGVEELLALRVEELRVDAGASPEQTQNLRRTEADRFECQLRRKDGVLLDIELSVCFSPQRKQFFCFLRDVTARLRHEQERARLAVAIAQVPDPVIIADPQGTIEYVNPAFEAISGWSSEDVLGQDTRSLKSGLHEGAYYQALWSTLRREGVWRGTFTNRCKDGSLYEVESSITAVVNAAGETTHYVAVQHDVSGLRLAQRLTTLGELVAGIAHEINNPITFFSLNIPILSELWDDVLPMLDELQADHPERKLARLPWSVGRTEIPRLLEGLRSGARRIKGMVSALKEFTSPDAGEPAGPFDVPQVIALSLALTGPHLRHKKPAIDVETPAELPQLWGIPARLEQVLVNLILNAVQSVPQVDGQILIAARVHPDELELAVEDNGPGVSLELGERIFEPFTTTRAKQGGTGLGLSISSQIVRGFGGRIVVGRSALGGAAFKVFLPTGCIAPLGT